MRTVASRYAAGPPPARVLPGDEHRQLKRVEEADLGRTLLVNHATGD
jgi:hypothetical protein